MNFKQLVRRYQTGKVQVVEKTDGYHDMNNGGEWVEGDSSTHDLTLFAIVPLSDEDLKFDEGGNYDDQSRKLYCYKSLVKGTKVVNTMTDGTVSEYKIMQSRNYSDHDKGLQIYYMRRVDRNDKDN